MMGVYEKMADLHFLFLRNWGGERGLRKDWAGWSWIQKDCLWDPRETQASTGGSHSPCHQPLSSTRPHLHSFLSSGFFSPRAETSVGGSKISKWKPSVKPCVGNEMPARGRQWLGRNHGSRTHLGFLWCASLISSPGQQGVSPQAHRSGFCIIHISPSFYFICFFSIISEHLSLKNINYRRLWIDVMWKEGGCFPSLQTGNMVFKTNKPLKPHEAHFNLFKWLFPEGKRKKKKQGNVFGAMSW